MDNEKSKWILVYDDKGTRSWSEHCTKAEAEDEANIMRAGSLLVLGIFEAEVPVHMPDLYLEGHDKKFGDSIINPAFAVKNKDKDQDKLVVAYLAGWELTVENMIQLQDWIEENLRRLVEWQK